MWGSQTHANTEISLKFCSVLYFIYLYVYVCRHTQSWHTRGVQWTTCESVLFLHHVSLGDWTQVLGLMTSLLTHWTIWTTPWLLILKSYVTVEHSTTAHECTALQSHWLHFPYTGVLHSFGTNWKHCLESSVVWCMRRHTVLCRSPYNGSWTESAWTKGMPAHLLPSPSHPPIQAGLQKCLCGHGESWMFHLQTGWGGEKSLLHAQWAGKVHPVFPLLYNNHFLQTWDKECWGKRNSPTYFYSQEHDPRAQAQRFTLGKAPV